MQTYTIIRGIMATMCAILYTGNMLGMILYGSVVTNPDDHHGFVIYTILSGIPITAFAGAFGYISVADIEEIHGKQYAYEEVSPTGGGVTRKMSKVMIFWTVILSILVAGAIYFWTAALVAITASHREMIPLGVVAAVYTILLIIAAFRCIHEYMRR